ncbi:MAG: hypothetical protein KBS54_01920, partial [Synergistaceae bacterium]|nr:hypothetical protein [Candidatus Equadaptatus faecalis]
MRSFKKAAAVLILVSFIFATISPAMASTGIGDASGAFRVNGELTLGEHADFLGTNWMLYKVDTTAVADGNKYAYVITTDNLGTSKFFSDYTAAKANQYSTSTIRGVVSTNTNSYEKQMIGYNPTTYTGTQASGKLTWEQINGGADRTSGSSEYIHTHHMEGESTTYGKTESVTTDKLYLLSHAEAQSGYFTNDSRRKAESYWWLRSPYPSYNNWTWCVVSSGAIDHYPIDGGVYGAGGVRPALQINLESPLFSSGLFKTAAEGGKDLVGVGTGFSLPDLEEGQTLNRLTVEYDTSKADTYHSDVKEMYQMLTTPTTAEVKTETVGETIETRVAAKTADNKVDLTHALLNGTQLYVKYAGNLTNADADWMAAVVKDSSGNYVNYAKLGTAEDSKNITGADAEGWFAVNTANLANGTYELYAFAEKIGGTVEDPTKAPDETTNPVADAASSLLKAANSLGGDTFTLSATYTNYATLEAEPYKDAGLIAVLGGDFNLSFENDTYDTGVTVGANDNGTITADATSGTTLTGAVTVGENATLTTANTFTLNGAISGAGTIENTGTLNVNGTLAAAVANAGSVTAKNGSTINSTVTNDTAVATLETGASFGENGKITGGNVTLGEDVNFKASNLGTLESFTSQGTGAVYSFSATLGDTTLIEADTLLTVSGTATGKIKLGEIKLNGFSSDNWALETSQEMQYLNAGADSNLVINGTKWVISEDGKNFKYTFSQAKDGDADKTGWMSVLKEVGYTLPQIITNNPEGAGTESGFFVNGTDTASVTKDLGALNNTLRDGEFTINGAADGTSILDGNEHGGIIVADTTKGGKEDDVLNIVDVTMKNFNTAVTNKEDGTVTLKNVIFEETAGDWDIINEGTVIAKEGTNKFDKGISGENGAIVAADGAILKGQGEDATTITTKTLDGDGALTVEDLTLVIGEGKDNKIDGDLALEDARLEGEGKDETTVTADTITSDGDAELK